MSDSNYQGQHEGELDPVEAAYLEERARYEQQPRDYMLPNKVYNVLKPVAQIFLPGITALYLTLAQVWGWPLSEQVAATTAAINVFLGLVLARATQSYNNSDGKYDGEFTVEDGEDGPRFAGQLLHVEDPRELAKMDEVVFKVTKH